MSPSDIFKVEKDQSQIQQDGFSNKDENLLETYGINQS